MVSLACIGNLRGPLAQGLSSGRRHDTGLDQTKYRHVPFADVERRGGVRQQKDIVALAKRIERTEGDVLVEPVTAYEQRCPACVGEREAERGFGPRASRHWWGKNWLTGGCRIMHENRCILARGSECRYAAQRGGPHNSIAVSYNIGFSIAGLAGTVEDQHTAFARFEEGRHWLASCKKDQVVNLQHGCRATARGVRRSG